MSHIYVDNELETLQDDVQMVARMIREGRYQDAHSYLEVHVIGDAEALMEELEDTEVFENEY